MRMAAVTHPQLVKALDLLLDVICIVDADGRFVAVSAACEQVFGYTQEELIGKPMIDLVFPADRARTLGAAATVVAGQALRNFENRYVRKDGEVIDIMWSARWSEIDQLRFAVAREVTQRKQTEAMHAALYGISEAAHSADDLTDLFRRIHQIIGNMLPAGNFLVALHDRKTQEITFPYIDHAHGMLPHACWPEYRSFAADIIRTGAAVLLTAETVACWPQAMQAAAGKEGTDWLGIPLAGHHGIIGALVVQSHSVRYSDQHKSLLQFVSTQIAANIERKQADARLQYMAQYDVLTGLPNRMLFDDRLQVALARADRDGERLSLLYLDLDHFKPVNDRFGHAVGDLLLQEVARRIRNCVRESDTVCRIGGDEFVVLLNSVQAPQDALAAAEKICSAINQPLMQAGHRLQVASSIGLAYYPEHGREPVQLKRNADAAMYRAKHRGGNQCLSFSADCEPHENDVQSA